MEKITPKDASDLVGAVASARAEGMRLLPVGGESAFSQNWPDDFQSLSLAGLDSQIDIDHSNLCVRVSAGVTVGDLHCQVESAGFLWHPVGYSDPRSTVGSVVSRNDGRRNLRFGTASDNLLGAEAVLGNDSVVRMGGKMIKFQTGYSLHHSLAGAWGQLGAFASLLLRLHPMPRSAILLEVRASDGADLALAVVALPSAGVFPAGVDFQCRPDASHSSAGLWLVGLSEREVTAMATRGSKIINESMGGRAEITSRQIPVSAACRPGSYQPWRTTDEWVWNVSTDVDAAIRAVASLVSESSGERLEMVGGLIDGTMSLRAAPSIVEKVSSSLRAAGSRPVLSDPRQAAPAPSSLVAFQRLKVAFDPDGVFPDWSRDR